MMEKKMEKIALDETLDECVTIVGLSHYYGGAIVNKGSILFCKKEPDNERDHEAISLHLPVVDKVGYIANNTFTVLKGTKSAGRIYDKVGDTFYIKVLFVNEGTGIAYVLRDNEKVLEKLWKEKFLEISEK